LVAAEYQLYLASSTTFRSNTTAKQNSDETSSHADAYDDAIDLFFRAVLRGSDA